MTERRISMLGWYARRAIVTLPAAVVWHLRDQVLRTLWLRRQVKPGQIEADTPLASERKFAAVLPPGTALLVPVEARAAVLDSAERILRGEWEVLGVVRTDLVQPDWFGNPVTGRRYAQDRFAFRIGRDREGQLGDIRQVWELSRLQHLTLLAIAWFLSHDERYAQRVADQLRSWWRENPFLSGVHWTSGRELGIRLISLAWIRRLLDDWPGAADLFERDALALRQIRWHQQYLAAFPSRGSSASSHVIAEAAGQLVASCAFPWFSESEGWRNKSALRLERELIRNSSSPSIAGRGHASDYECFIVELGFLAAAEADASGYPLRSATWARLCTLADSAAALVDDRLRAPRHGGCDEGRGLLLDTPTPNRRPSMLALAEALVGRQEWWPRPPANAASSIVGALAGSRRQIAGRPNRRPSCFADAGITLLRTSGKNEIWCRCDSGPHGCRGDATDALSFEVRFAGVDILADPGTLCCHGERAWFRSTNAHNIREIEVLDDGDIARWIAEHDEYASVDPSALHRRSVLLDRASRSIDIIDQIDGTSHDIRLAFHLGPDVHAELEEFCAALDWSTACTPGAARLELPPELQWSLHKGETDPILGRYSQGWGAPASAVALVGCGRCVPGMPLITRLEFLEVGESGKSVVWAASHIMDHIRRPVGYTTEIEAEAR